MQISTCDECKQSHKISDFDIRLMCQDCTSYAKIGELYCGRHLVTPSKLCKCGLKLTNH